MDSRKENAEGDDRDIELSGTSGRQRSINSIAPEGAASAGGLAHHPQSRIVRPRSRSSTSTTYPDNAGPLSSLGESVDMSALSVEVAVAGGRESQYSPAKADRKHGRRTSASHSRSSTVYIPKSRPGTPSRRSSASRVMPQERGSRSTSKVSGSAGNIVDEDEGNVNDEESQAVIRRHQPQRSMPSIIDVFNLPQPNIASYSRPPRSRSPSVSLTGEELAASRHPDEPRRLSSISPRCSKPSDLGGLESKVDPAESCAPPVDRGNRSPSTNKSTQDHNEVSSQPGVAVIPSSASSILSSIAWLHDEPDDLKDSSYVLEEDEHGGGSATVVTAADGPANDRIVETETGESLEEGVVQVRHQVRGEGRPASRAQRIQRRFLDRRQSDSPGENGVAFGGFMQGETVPVTPDSHPTESAPYTARSRPFQSEEDRRVLPTSGKLKDALSSTTDDENRMGHALGAGFLATDGHPAVEGEADLDGLEKGEPYHASLPRSETAKTMSQTETPNSKNGTPRSRGAASGHSRAKSFSSSYHDSVDMVRRDDVVRIPSAHMQNKAKHMAEQKRGVTTSYKSEELYTQFRKMGLFLVVLGLFSGLGAHGIDKGIEQISMLGDIILDRGSAALGGGSGVKFFFYWLYDVALTGFAAFLTAYFASGVGGSGIPAMKYMMDTDDLAKKLKLKFSLVAIAVKATGLMLASGGGLNVGREGPYTHLAGMVSYQIIDKVPYFGDILHKETVLRQVLAASVAVGVSSTFAATIGGVLFSIEITTLYYDVGNYFKAFVAAISGTVGVSLVRTLGEGSSEYITRDFSEDEYEVWQYPVYAAIGVLCGFLGPLYINFRLHMLKLARKWGKHDIRDNTAQKREYVKAAMAVACLVATITAALTFFPGEFTRLTPLATFKELLSEGSLPDYWSSGYVSGIFFALPVSIAVWFITAALGTSVTVPAGDFIQTVVIGATVGRLIGEALDAHGSPGVTPSTFALVGAAAMSCGATQTISAAVVIMEVTGSFNLDKPILLGAVVAFAFSRKFGLNIYDSVMALNGLESLYGLDMRRSEEMTAKDIMETNMLVVPCQTTIGELLDTLRGGEHVSRMFESYPVVTNFEAMSFVGTVSRKDLVHIVLTGGSRLCYDLAYFDYIFQHLHKRDLPDAWDKIGDILSPSDKRRVFERLPRNVKDDLGASLPSAGNTLRALKMLAHLPDLSFLKSSTSKTFGKRFGTEPRDPRDRNRPSDRQTLNTLFMANWENGAMENPYERRPVDITMIAQQASGAVNIDRSVWKAHENMPLRNVYLLFTNLRCIRLFIISGDQLTGIISRSILYNALSNRDNLGDSGRAYLDCSRTTRRFSSGYPKKKFALDLILGSGPRNGL